MLFGFCNAGTDFENMAGEFTGCLVLYYLCHYKSGKLEKKHLLPQIGVAGYAMSLGLAQALNQVAMMIVQIVMNNSLTHYGAASTSEYESGVRQSR